MCHEGEVHLKSLTDRGRKTTQIGKGSKGQQSNKTALEMNLVLSHFKHFHYL